MAKNKIICNGVSFTEEKIKSGSIFLSNSIAFNELGIDTLDSELDLSTDDNTRTIFAPKDADRLHTVDNQVFLVQPYFKILVTDPSKFTYGKKVEYYRDEKIFQVFYMSTIRRVGDFLYAISCVSAVGLLDTVMHYGGLYTGQTFSTVVSSIIGKLVTYTTASNVSNIRVYGWLPVASARDNLKQLLFASGVALKKNNSGNISFELLDTSVPSQIADERIMIGGSVDYPASADEAIVVEHSFFSTSLDETVTLFDGDAIASTLVSPNGVARSGILVTFEQPSYGLSVSGASILESGVNYAVLSGGGHAVLTGKQYTHTTREVKKTVSAASSNMVGEKNVVKVEDATLVTVLNSEALVERIASYYSSVRTLNEKILVNAERPGDYVSMNNPFAEKDTGIISSMDINISSTLLADTKIVIGYKPVSSGGFDNVRLLTGSGTFSVPSGKTKIRAILIGGGNGGNSGQMGKPGVNGQIKDDFYSSKRSRDRYMITGTGGNGGAAGAGGSGGKIYQITLDVTSGQNISYSCGSGGAGGVSNKNRNAASDTSVVGSNGGNTTFGAYSSANGSASAYGYVDIISGNTYASAGKSGIAGGKGGGILENVDILESQTPGPNVVYNGVTYKGGENHLEREVTSSTFPTSSTTAWSIGATAFYGAGGGAAAGANGNKSTDKPTVSARAYGEVSGTASATGGAGGQGGDAVAPSKNTTYGAGGTGGNGGGGAGGSGLAGVSTAAEGYPSGTDPQMPAGITLKQNAGLPGLGSNGGAGGDGCILVYY